jgi:hypothetical protein
VATRRIDEARPLLDATSPDPRDGESQDVAALQDSEFAAGLSTDDFMPKPFAVPELVARVRRLLCRTYGI